MSGIGTTAIVEINQTANRYQSSIVIHADNKYIDVKSILGLTLTLIRDELYRLDVHGPDETEAREAMKVVFEKHGLAVRFEV
ncbi:HPr family phosphocarrier protein [Cohnella pontilimi]|uniref:HPr family phosphocarrier protein n=1 Tax=Cohnella pontilimi TaxID=2564100 RepID=A0A4U0F6P5_9BACL|nr:HPr family phosphocarrier protein [Cohnella pontilimi]TJY39614.1 HPr family phosphocarrier protein [Cohnella pontilimi]